MSSTNRGGQRSEADWYATPPWCVHRLLDEFELSYPDGHPKRWQNLPGGRWLEPCAGDGEIIRAVNSRRSDIEWSACELRVNMQKHLQPLVRVSETSTLVMGDLLQTRLEDFGGKRFDVAITNPPFRIAMPIVRKCRELADMTIMLLRLNFWGSDDRQPFMWEHAPDTYVLPNRPMFSINKKGKPGTDSPEYAWMVWYTGDDDHGDARIKVLNRTPALERKAWGEHLKKLYAAISQASQPVPHGS